MDYEFRRNSLDGSYHVTFSMGHEAIGRWLLDELTTDSQRIERLLSALEDQKKPGTEELQWRGKVFTLTANREEVLIQANALLQGGEDIEEPDLALYEEESISVCGLEDFTEVIEAWRDFIARYGR